MLHFPKTYSSIQPPKGLPIFVTLPGSFGGSIAGIKFQSDNSNAVFEVFSGAQGNRLGKVKPEHLENGRIPRGRYFIVRERWNTKLNSPKTIRRLMQKNRLMDYPNVSTNPAKDRRYWLVLYRDDSDRVGVGVESLIDDRTTVLGKVRDSFSLHVGQSSLGCITFRKNRDYFNFITLLSGGESYFIDRATGRISKTKTDKFDLEVYGVIEVN